MPADEIKLALRYTNILETEAFKNRCQLKLDCSTYGIEIFTRFGLICSKLIFC